MKTLASIDQVRFNTGEVQTYPDSWNGRKIVHLHYEGQCVMCQRRTYAHPDAGNDPRGFLGDHAASPLIAAEYDMSGPDVPACFMCQNDTSKRYERILATAKTQWTVPSSQIKAGWKP